jgi:dihydroceramidase
LTTISDERAQAFYLGIEGIANTKRNRNDGVILLSSALRAFLGVSSAAYHTNKKYWAQIGTSFQASKDTGNPKLGMIVVVET